MLCLVSGFNNSTRCGWRQRAGSGSAGHSKATGGGTEAR